MATREQQLEASQEYIKLAKTEKERESQRVARDKTKTFLVTSQTAHESDPTNAAKASKYEHDKAAAELDQTLLNSCDGSVQMDRGKLLVKATAICGGDTAAGREIYDVAQKKAKDAAKGR
ncbi:hypothetical protein BD410DRAFT_844331 [Rickenella mellea]|uniref:Uncharacterized protein n=1 Tax=Rickenella mellea TaxID=50990 RepID=A0A4Y7PNT7_9AGAM|nr:hypothetical protein BD410DRAFT_844331 [Rickenella mellea]